MFYYESPSLDPCWNLALEEHLLGDADPASAYFLLWQNQKTIVVGRNQNTAEEVDLAYARRHGIRVVRRLSGGGAVYHDAGNLNYTFIVPLGPEGAGAPVLSSAPPAVPEGADGEGRAAHVGAGAADGEGWASDADAADGFRLFADPLLKALASFGITARFDGRNDVLIGQKKISGCAQCISGGRLLHHGCILLDSDLEVLQRALRVREGKIASKGIRSVRSRVTTINAHASRRISLEEFKWALRSQVARQQTLVPYAPSEKELAAIEKLASKKYASREWTYGNDPACSIRREGRFMGGLVCVSLELGHGIIQAIHITGDFFGSRDVAELERALTGAALDSGLEPLLRALPVSEYMHGVRTEEFASLLR